MTAKNFGILVTLIFAGAAASHAEIRLPAALSDHAAPQRGAPICIWGCAEPGAKLTVGFHAQTGMVAADRLVEWTARLTQEPPKAPTSLR
jgi:hypothetical protein